MPTDAIDKLMMEVASLRRQVGNMVRPATVHEVKGDKVRMAIGKDKDGKEVLGPWLDTSSLRGGARERRFFKKGQNLMLFCPNGDLTQAVISPYAPNKKFKAPDHANKEGQDEETYQLENLRVRKTKKGYAIWLQDPKQEEQEEGDGDPHKESDPKSREPQKPKAKSVINLSNDGGITGRIGTKVRFAASEKGAKLKSGENYIEVTNDNRTIVRSKGNLFAHAEGVLYANKPWILKKGPNQDPIPDDDKVIDQDEDDEGS